MADTIDKPQMAGESDEAYARRIAQLKKDAGLQNSNAGVSPDVVDKSQTSPMKNGQQTPDKENDPASQVGSEQDSTKKA